MHTLPRAAFPAEFCRTGACGEEVACHEGKALTSQDEISHPSFHTGRLAFASYRAAVDLWAGQRAGPAFCLEGRLLFASKSLGFIVGKGERSLLVQGDGLFRR